MRYINAYYVSRCEMHTVETIIETAGTTPLSDWPVWICLMILLAIEAVYAAELHIPRRRNKKDADGRPYSFGQHH